MSTPVTAIEYLTTANYVSCAILEEAKRLNPNEREKAGQAAAVVCGLLFNMAARTATKKPVVEKAPEPVKRQLATTHKLVRPPNVKKRKRVLTQAEKDKLAIARKVAAEKRRILKGAMEAATESIDTAPSSIPINGAGQEATPSPLPQ